MKKVISVFLALVMCLSLAVPAFAVEGGTVDWGPKEPDMCLTLPTEIVVYDDRSGNYTVGATEVRNAGKAKATITDVQVSPSQGWSLSDWDATRGNVPVDAKTFSMRVFDAAVGSTGHVTDTSAFPSLPKDASADMGVSFWMAPQRNIDGRPQVADVVVTAEFEEDLSVHAILYDSSELVFQRGSTPEAGRTVSAVYAGVETATTQLWEVRASFIKTVTFNCDVAPISTASWFRFCRDLDTINGIEKLDTRNVTNMSSMFYNCPSLTSLDVTGFDTSNVTDMSSMFSSCPYLTSLDVSSFDTSNVTDMSDMFYNCPSLTSLDVTGFDTSNVTDMSSMFAYCYDLTTIYATDSFVTTNATSSTGMFSRSSELVGGRGTVYDSTHTDKEYARIDTADTPGYFTAKPITVTVENHTNAAATVTEPSNGWRLGANTFSVSSEKVCAVGLLRDGACTELGYSSESGADHVFKADLQEGDAIVVVLRGDADLNGRINVGDVSPIQWKICGTYGDRRGYANILAMDVNHDGKINCIDSACVQRASISAYTSSWKPADAPEPQMTELAGTFDNTEFTLGQSDAGKTTGTLSFAYDDTATRFDGFAIDFDWTELKGATDILGFSSGTYFDDVWDRQTPVFTIAVTTDGVSGDTLYDGTSGSVDIGTLSQFVSTVVGYNGNSKRDYKLLGLTFIFNGNLAPGTYEVPITIRELYDGSNPDAPVYYADENHPIHLTAVLEVPEVAAAMEAALLDSMAAPGLDTVTGPAEPVPELPAGDGTYEVDPDTEVVEVPETPIFDVEPETPEVPTEPSKPEEPAGDQVETPDEGATEPEPGEEPAEGPDDVPASPDVEPSQDPEPAAKPDEEDPAPDAGNQDGDGEGVPDTETPEDAQPPDTDGEATSDAPEDPGQD